MGARRVEDLFVWRLAAEIKSAIIALTANRPFGANFKLRSDLGETANSIEANISEGFVRYYPRDFARFLRYSRSSAQELLTHLGDAHERKIISNTELTHLRTKSQHLSRALLRLIRYLEEGHHPSR